jgi:hypothetical protein
MFTWVCQRCGKEVDISEVECPHCAVQARGAELGSAQGAARGPLEQPLPPPREARLLPPRRQESATPPLPLPASTVPRPPPQPHALAVRPLHLALFLLVLLISLAGAVYLARPDLISVEGVSLPKLPRRTAAPLQQGPIEVAGVRAWRDTDANLKVRAVLVNHGESPSSAGRLRVTLRDPEAEDSAPAAATFEVELAEPLAARESREVEADLVAPEGLTALPEWNRMRVELEPIGSQP